MNEVGDFLSLINRIKIKSFRNAKKLKSKYESTIMFNHVCLRERTLPKYTDLHLRNPRTRDADFTIKFRITLLETEMKDISIHLENLSSELVVCQNDSIENNPELSNDFTCVLNIIYDTAHQIDMSRITKNLNNLYRGNLYLPQFKKTVFNLSSAQLTKIKEEVLNLGMNFPISSQFDLYLNKQQMESVYQQLKKLEKGH